LAYNGDTCCLDTCEEEKWAIASAAAWLALPCGFASFRPVPPTRNHAAAADGATRPVPVATARHRRAEATPAPVRRHRRATPSLPERAIRQVPVRRAGLQRSAVLPAARLLRSPPAKATHQVALPAPAASRLPRAPSIPARLQPRRRLRVQAASATRRT